jgi:excisionase family DNA binding protein
MKKIFTPQEIAELLHIAPTTIYAELKKGKLSHTRIGRKYIITRRQLEDYLTKEVVEELLGEERETSEIDEISQWLDVAAQDMSRAIAAAERGVPESERREWLKAMEAAVKPLEVGNA